MKSRKLTIILIFFIGILSISYFAYNNLSKKYDEKNIESNIYSAQINDNNKEIDSVKKQKAKDFTVYDEDSNEVNLSDYIGRPVVVNFWASWCPPCKREMPFFNEMAQKYDESDVAFLMISLTDGNRETVDTAKKFIKDNNFDMDILFDKDGDAAYKNNILYIPRTLFIDKDGYVVEDYSGEITKEKLDSQIQSLLQTSY